jgi:exonuclease SbcC
MRPLSLTIKNFLSYGENPQTIDFDNESIISFIGNNGHGKSALLESITWALWGQARRSQGVTKSDDMLLHLGSHSMFVTLTIIVKNNIYKIHRTCEKKHNRIYTNLEFYSIVENEEKNLANAHQKDTQALIEKIIGISYDMFINTVYLKQGASNEFSKRTPKERKDILCSILKIDQIEEMRQDILSDIKKIIQEREILLKLEEKLLDKKKEEQLKQYETIIKQIGEELEAIRITISQDTKVIVEYEKNINHNAKIIADIQDTIKNKDSIIQDLYKTYTNHNFYYQKYKEAMTTYQQFQQNNPQKKNLERLVDTTTLIQEYEQKILDIETAYAFKKNELESSSNSSLEEINKKITDFIEQSNECHVFQIKQKIYTIDNYLSSYNQNGKTCFACDQTISNTPLIQQKITILESQKIELLKLQENYTTMKKDTLLQFEQEKRNITEEKIETIRELDKNYQQTKNEYKNKIEVLRGESRENKDIIHKETKKSILWEEIEAFRNKGILTELKKTIYTVYTHKFEKLAASKKLHDYELCNKKITMEKNNHEIVIKKGEAEYQKKERELQQIQNYSTLLAKQIEENHAELKKIQEDLQEKEKILKIKSNLAHILSKNNLQAALIEEAIPLIEEEANKILQKLTNGSSKIYIESMKDLKSGSIKETLDIKIADQIGLRYYEFFSGGEAFRIDLALRIALVKLLAQKSGHIIKTFIIDEGFGSQDNTSLEIIIDTLFMLQNEFDLIIIISHLNDMKEQFPVQFYIEKTMQGSIIKKI